MYLHSSIILLVILYVYRGDHCASVGKCEVQVLALLLKFLVCFEVLRS